MHTTSNPDPAKSWEVYNVTNDFLNTLAAHGYQLDSERSDKITFTPPGGKRGQIVFYQDRRALFAYADNPHFDKGKGYDPTGVYAALEHGGNRSDACRALLALGYGERTQRTPEALIAASDGRGSHSENRSNFAPARNLDASQAGPKLLANHGKQLDASAIAEQQIADRGYETVTDPARLRALGFGREQSENVPGLLIPYQNAVGEAFYQYRPDRARQGGPKYETPPGKPGRYGLDVPAACREKLLDGSVPLWITEGAKKADAGAGAGLCIVSLPGVWMFLRENEAGKKAMLADFDAIPLRGRVVVICYDSDAMRKPSVYAALRRLANGLRGRGAVVKFCYLPDDAETKIGLDDYLAAGHSTDALHALVSDTLLPIAAGPTQALLDSLNRQFAGRAVFTTKGAQMQGEAKDGDTLAAMKAVFNQQTEFDNDCRFMLGDLGLRLVFSHGDKMKTLENTIGKNNAANLSRWGTVCREFSGERDYFRHCMPLGHLQEIASCDHDKQDALLAEYLQSADEGGDRMKRERLRERVRELRGLPITHDTTSDDNGEGSRPGAVAPDARMLQTLLQKMRPETVAAFHALRDEQGPELANKLLAAVLPDALAYAVQLAHENAHAEEEEPADTFLDIDNVAPIYIDTNLQARGEERAEQPPNFAPAENLDVQTDVRLHILDRPAPTDHDHAPQVAPSLPLEASLMQHLAGGQWHAHSDLVGGMTRAGYPEGDVSGALERLRVWTVVHCQRKAGHEWSYKLPPERDLPMEAAQ